MLGSGHPFYQSPVLTFTFCSVVNASQLLKPQVHVLLLLFPPSFITHCSHSKLPMCCQYCQSSQWALFVYFFCNDLVFSSHCSQTPSINKQTHAVWLVCAATGLRTTEGQEDDSYCHVSTGLRRQGREENRQLEGVGWTVIFKNTRRSLYLAR